MLVIVSVYCATVLYIIDIHALASHECINSFLSKYVSHRDMIGGDSTKQQAVDEYLRNEVCAGRSSLTPKWDQKGSLYTFSTRMIDSWIAFKILELKTTESDNSTNRVV